MYVIFPVDELLDINSVRKTINKRPLQSQLDLSKGQTEIEVNLTPTHPSHKLPGQQPLTSPVNKKGPSTSSSEETPGTSTSQGQQQQLKVQPAEGIRRSKSPSRPAGSAQQSQQQVSTNSGLGLGSGETSPLQSVLPPPSASQDLIPSEPVIQSQKKQDLFFSQPVTTLKKKQDLSPNQQVTSLKKQDSSSSQPATQPQKKQDLSQPVAPSQRKQDPAPSQPVAPPQKQQELDPCQVAPPQKKKVSASSSWAGTSSPEDSEVRPPGSQSFPSSTSDNPCQAIYKNEIPRTQLIKSNSFRLLKESPQLPSESKEKRIKAKPSKTNDLVVESIPETVELKVLKSGPKPEVKRDFRTLLKPDLKLDIESISKNKPDQKESTLEFIKNEFFPPDLDVEESADCEGILSRGGSAASSFRESILGRGASVKSNRGLYSPTQQPFRSDTRSDMAAETSLKDLTHPALNETLKANNSVTFKLIKTVSEFTAQLSQIHERHSEDLQHLIETFRKKHSDLRNERPPCSSFIFQIWESLLQEVEVDSQLHSDVAGTLVRQVSRPLVEKTFHSKIQSRKLFTHRDSIETILAKTEDMLKKCRKENTDTYQAHCRTQSNASLAAYFDAHNAYVQQLHATNAMLHFYNTTALPALLKELEEVHVDVASVFMECLLLGVDTVAVKSEEQSKRYDVLGGTCRNGDPRSDVVTFVKYFDTPQMAQRGVPQHRFIPPTPPVPTEGTGEDAATQDGSLAVPPLKNELALDRLAALSSKPRYESLNKEAADLEKQISSLQDSLETLLRGQQRNLESSLYHKANELQEDISMKRFDVRVSQVHLAAIKAQRELFASKEGTGSENRERKMSNSSSGSMKSKWMKAFKSLKPPTGGAGPQASGPSGASARDNNESTPNPLYDKPKSKYSFAATVLSAMAARKNGRERGDESPGAQFESAHILQEYSYKKITPCDVCHQILRGHSRQGMKCRLCKINVHFECQDRLPPRCQTKSRLLRRQRSTSEIESKQMDAGDEEAKPQLGINMFIASQPGRRMRGPSSPPTPTTPGATSLLLPPRSPLTANPASSYSAGRTAEEVDLIYQVLKQAGDLSGRRSTPGSMERDLGGSGPSSGSGSASSLQRRYPQSRPTHTGPTLTVNPPPIASSSAPISPRRQKLNLRMKSISLDSPESTEQRRRQGGGSGGSSHQTSHAASYCQSPSSPVHNRHLLTTHAMRMSSVELPDDLEKSYSSASTSPCPSPVSKKPHRLLPTNLYVVLYNFTSRHSDELDLRAGYKVTVTDTSDPDWWQGKCLGRTGYFPSKYVTRLNAGEKPLQVTHNLQVSDGENGIKLLRDQIVIQIGEELDGMVMIRNGDHQQGVCPVKYLQEA